MKKVFAASLFFTVIFSTLQIFGMPQIETFDWKKSKKIAKGVKYATWEKKSPRLMKIFAVRIDLSNPDLKFHITGRAENWGEKMPDFPKRLIRTKRETTLDFLKKSRKKRTKMVAAFNASPWTPWEKPFTHTYADRLGLIISNGELVSYPNGRASLIIDKKGKIYMDSVKKDADLSNIANAVTGFSFVLRNGVVSGANKALAPRTGYGLSKDKKYLYIFVVDGRQPQYSMGMTHKEVGDFLHYLGAFDGINMDGGGSSSMVLFRKGKAKMVNHQPGNGMRKVGSSLGISVD